MPSTIVGVLLEHHRDHIMLANGTQIFLEEGTNAKLLPVGATLTILCTAQGNKKFAHYIRVNPDCVLESLEALAGPDRPALSGARDRRRSVEQTVSPRLPARREGRRREA